MGWKFLALASRFGARTIAFVIVILLADTGLLTGPVRAQTTLDHALDLDRTIGNLLANNDCVDAQLADSLAQSARDLVAQLDFGLTSTQGRSPIAEKLEKDTRALLRRKCPPHNRWGWLLDDWFYQNTQSGTSDKYVKVCSLYGSGFYYIPGTDTCVKIEAAAGFANFSGSGSISSFDDITLDRDQRSQSYSRTGGSLGLLGTVYGRPLNFGGGAVPFVRTGIIGDFGVSRTSSFGGLGDNVAEGTTKVSQDFSIPMLGGFQIPIHTSAAGQYTFAVASFEIFGGGMWDHRKASFALSEIATPEITSGSKTQMQLNPAVGFGTHLLRQWNGIPVEIGASVIFDFQRPIHFTTQSVPFPSAFYTLNTGHQVNTTILFTTTFPTAFGTPIRRP